MLFICTREGETSRLTAVGAGGITLVERAGAERAWPRETWVDAGAITSGFKVCAAIDRSRETLGAGAMMLGSRRGVYRVCSERMLVAGGITAAFIAGATRELEAALGAGGTTELSDGAPRDWSRVRFTFAGAITLAGRLGAVSEERKPSAGGGPGSFFGTARRLATAPGEEGSLRSGASTI
jgi:hypothetical protein